MGPKPFVGGTALEVVVARGRDDALDVLQRVVADARARGGAHGQVDGDRSRVAPGEFGDVEPGASVDVVVAQSPSQHVGLEGGAVAAHQRVVAAGADDTLEADEGVVAPTTRGASCLQIDVHRVGKFAIVGIVDTTAGLASAVEDVVTTAAAKRVAVAVAGDRVVAVRPVDILDTAERIVALPAGGRASGEVHRHRAEAARGVALEVVVRGVRSRAADQRVVAQPTRHVVVAVAAFQRVVAILAAKLVVAAAALQQVVPAHATEAVVAVTSAERVIA